MRIGILSVMSVFLFLTGCASSQSDVATLDCSAATNPCAGLSAIDRKYAERNPRHYADVARAKELLDSWYGQQQRLLEAARLLENVLRVDDEFAPAVLQYGRVFGRAAYISGREYDPELLVQSRTWFLKAIELEPDYAAAFIKLSSNYINSGRHDEAREALARAEEIGTDDPGVLLNYAAMLRREGRDQAALELYERIIEQGKRDDPAFAAAAGLMASIYVDDGRYEEAKAAYELRLEVAPDSAWYWGGYSRFLLFRLGDVDGAIASGRTALSIMSYGEGRFGLACALFTKWGMMVEENGDTEASQRVFDEAFGLYPDLDRVIRLTEAHEHTKVAATQLSLRAKGR